MERPLRGICYDGVFLTPTDYRITRCNRGRIINVSDAIDICVDDEEVKSILINYFEGEERECDQEVEGVAV